MHGTFKTAWQGFNLSTISRIPRYLLFPIQVGPPSPTARCSCLSFCIATKRPNAEDVLVPQTAKVCFSYRCHSTCHCYCHSGYQPTTRSKKSNQTHCNPATSLLVVGTCEYHRALPPPQGMWSLKQRQKQSRTAVEWQRSRYRQRDAFRTQSRLFATSVVFFPFFRACSCRPNALRSHRQDLPLQMLAVDRESSQW